MSKLNPAALPPIHFRTMRETLAVSHHDLSRLLGGRNRDLLRRWDTKASASRPAWDIVNGQLLAACDMINTALARSSDLPDGTTINLTVHPDNGSAQGAGITMPAIWHRALVGMVALTLASDRLAFTISYAGAADPTSRTCARFRTLREVLGIRRRDLAGLLGTHPDLVTRWDFTIPPPRAAWQVINQQATDTITAINTALDQADTLTPGAGVHLTTYGTDESAQAAGITYPASWHRATTGAVAVTLASAGAPYRIDLPEHERPTLPPQEEVGPLVYGVTVEDADTPTEP